MKDDDKRDTVAVFVMPLARVLKKLAVIFLAQFLLICEVKIAFKRLITLINNKKNRYNYGKNYWY